MKPGDWLAEQIFGSIAENTAETFVDKQKIAARGHNGEQFPGYRDESVGSLLRKFHEVLGHQTLRHSPKTKMTAAGSIRVELVPKAGKTRLVTPEPNCAIRSHNRGRMDFMINQAMPPDHEEKPRVAEL
jgi:hypothetical protein